MTGTLLYDYEIAYSLGVSCAYWNNAEGSWTVNSYFQHYLDLKYNIKMSGIYFTKF